MLELALSSIGLLEMGLHSAILMPSAAEKKENWEENKMFDTIMIGSEGGFSPEEAARAEAAGMKMTGLGKRILRTETAAPFVLGCLVYRFEM